MKTGNDKKLQLSLKFFILSYTNLTMENIMAMGDTLVAKGVVTADQLNKALDEQKKSGDRLGDVLVKLGFTTKEKIDAALG